MSTSTDDVVLPIIAETSHEPILLCAPIGKLRVSVRPKEINQMKS
jgi:hypothetical protein